MPEIVYCQNVKCNLPEEEVREGSTRMMRCSACQYTTYCSRECQKADWKEHKKNCQAHQKADAMMTTLTDINGNFASDYDQWKTSVQFTLMLLSGSVLYDGDLIFTHYIALDVDYRPNVNSLFEKFFIKIDSLRVVPCDDESADESATIKANMKDYRRRNGVKERIAFIIFSCSGDTLPGFKVVRIAPMGSGSERPPKKADACQLIDLINAGAQGELENNLHQMMK